MDHSRLALMLPDADQLTGQEIGAALELKPAAFLVMCFAQWDSDKGVAQQARDLVLSLAHDRLYVRFHADPSPPAYARSIGGAEAWGRLCANRMGQYYGNLGVTLHAILANEVDAVEEGRLNPQQASDFYRHALAAYGERRPQDVLHVPATTGAPQTHRMFLQQYARDGWVRPEYWIDGHGYDGDLENVCAALEAEFPDHYRAITETNDVVLADAAKLVGVRAHEIIYFTLNWARGGEGRVRPPSADDAAKQMSLLRFPDRYAEFKATIRIAPPVEPPEEPTMPLPEGIDVSNNNGSIDWDAVASAGVSFGIAKITEGTWFRDGFFAENWSELRRVGLYRGAYHFARPSVRSAEQEADYFLDAFELLGCAIEPGDLLALDLEDPDVAPGWDLSGYTLAWLRRVEERVGFKPLCYTSPGYAQEHKLAKHPEIGEYGLWLASWGVPTPPAAPAPWDLVAFHQWGVTGVGSVPGVDGKCDRNRFNGTADAIPAYGKPAPVEPPAPIYSVGEGLLDKMTALGDQPASDEEFHELWSQAKGVSGLTYVYFKGTGEIAVYPPTAA